MKAIGSVKLKRADHMFSLLPPSPTGLVARGRAGNVVPMNGGYLTLGAYFADIEVGVPAQTLSVLVDTGSSNTAVPVAACTSCGAGPFYAMSRSRTAKPIACDSVICQTCIPEGEKTDRCVFGAPFCANDGLCGYGITYGGGSSGLYGSYVTEQVCLGSQCGNTSLGMIRDQYLFQTNFNSSSTFYGILGLAYPFNACNPSCTTPIYEDISKQLAVPNIVGMCLTGTQGGVMDLGFVDDSKYSGSLQWVPVVTKRWYNIELKDIRVGSQSLGMRNFMYVTTNDVIGAFVDSGTSVILTGPAAFTMIQNIFLTSYSHLPGVTSLFPPTSACVPKGKIDPVIDQFPQLSWVIGAGLGKPDVILHTSPRQYLMDTGDNYCLGIAGTPSIGVVLGDVFMESYYIVFDRVNDRLGFAPVANCN